jgi:hypothetical protein
MEPVLDLSDASQKPALSGLRKLHGCRMED